jgi:hypothetical protein
MERKIRIDVFDSEHSVGRRNRYGVGDRSYGIHQSGILRFYFQRGSYTPEQNQNPAKSTNKISSHEFQIVPEVSINR